MAESITIATRGSKLALWQTEYVRERLIECHPGLEVSLNVISTKGDQVLDTALHKIGDKGLFTAELQRALRDGSSDIAVHSFKDLETSEPEGLSILAVLEREDPRDVLLLRKDRARESAQPLSALPEGAVLGTGSLRRRAQALSVRPDLEIKDLRGNVDTRVGKLVAGDYDGILLAAAGVIRLGYIDGENFAFNDNELRAQLLCTPLDEEAWIPASCQGAVAVEGRSDDKDVAALLAPLNHDQTRTACNAERAFLAMLEGGCQIPAGVHARITTQGSVNIRGGVFSLDGTQSFIGEMGTDSDNASQSAATLARRLLDEGASNVLPEGNR